MNETAACVNCGEQIHYDPEVWAGGTGAGWQHMADPKGCEILIHQTYGKTLPKWTFIDPDCERAKTCVCGFCKREGQCDWGDCRNRSYNARRCVRHAKSYRPSPA